MQRVILTLAFIVKDEKILLGYKKKSGLGMGKWNGFGGKVQEGENVETAAKRELLEESVVTATFLERRGIQEFIRAKAPDEILEVHVFLVKEYLGSPEETEEMLPRWFSLNKIPFEKMWDDDKYWLPVLLENRFFVAKFWLDRDENVVEYKINTNITKQLLLEQYPID